MLQEATLEMTTSALMHGKEREADKVLHVQFYNDAIPDEIASLREGRAMFREVDFVMIMVPGDKYSIVRRPVQQRDKERFADRYRAFKLGRAQEHASGTPLHTVTWLTRAQVKELEAIGCHTLENLAGMPDSTVQKFMALYKLKQQAQDAIQAAKDAAPLLGLRAEIEKKDGEIASLVNALKDTQAQVAALQNAVMGQVAQQNAQVPEPRARATGK